jgi:uncharacterized protein (TIRG00374 family)
MRKIVLNSIIIIATSIVLVLLVFFTDGAQNLIAMVVRTEYIWLIAAFGCTFLFWVFGSFTVGALKRGIVGKENDPGQNFKTVMVGMFFSSITPFATGGQPAQIYMLKRMGVDAGTGTSIIILKSVFYQSTIMLMCIGFYIANSQFLVMNIPQFNLLFAIGCIANLFLLSLYGFFLFNSKAAENAVWYFLKLMAFFRIIRNPKEKMEGLHIYLGRFKNGVRILSQRKRYILIAFIMQLIQFAALFSVPILMMRAIEGAFISIFGGVFDIFVCTAMVVMIAALVPTPGTSGGAEGLSLLCIAPFFYNSPKMSIVLVWRLLTYYANVVVGGIFCLLIKEKPLASKEVREDFVET